MNSICGLPKASSDVATLTGNVATYVVNPLLAFLFALGLLIFVWGFVEFLFDLNVRGGGGEGTGKNNGKQHMLWGLVGMFIMSGAWAILSLISCTVAQLLQ